MMKRVLLLVLISISSVIGIMAMQKSIAGVWNGILKIAPKMELKRPQNPHPPYPYTMKEITINNLHDSITLSGTLTLPEGYTSSTPAVVMITGSGIQNREEEICGHKSFAVIADYLARNGIASFWYDNRGYGKSTGYGKIATTENFTRDARVVLEYIRMVENFNYVGILGHSDGAAIALTFGAEHQANNNDVCVIDPTQPDFIVAIGAQALQGDTILIDQNATILGHGRFVLYGKTDIQSKTEQDIPQIQRLAPTAKIKLYPELNHLFQHTQTGYVQENGAIEEAISLEVLQDIVDFILSIIC
ncbi:MAG: lysophospholipase [Lachnospiraceae bacterium]|nr:lysophospholipase [Lachnospiraceae bacterium]